MSLSQGSWSPASGMRENWLVQIDDSSGSNKKYYSFFDQTVNSVAYSGRILNSPSIRESINIFKSTTSVSNLTLEIDNSDETTDTLLFGTNTYLNRDVRIYSCLDSGAVANFNDIPLIYTGRLESMTHNESSVTLNIVAKMPWDNVPLPNQYSSAKNTGSVVYGDYTGNSGANFTSGYTNSNYHPAPYDSSNEFIDQVGTANLSNVNAAEYSKKYDKFIPYLGADSSTSTSGAAQTFTVPNIFFQSYYEQAASQSASSVSGISVANGANSIDGNLTNYTTITCSGTGLFAGTETFTFGITSTHSNSNFVAKYKVQTSSGVNDRNVIVTLTADGKSDANSHASTTSDTSVEISNLSQGTTSATLTIAFNHVDLGTDGYSFVVRLYEMYVSYAVYGDDQDVVYSATDGPAANSNWDSSGGTVLTELHEFHRDICHKYLGLTDTPIGYSDLNSAKAWQGRLWETKSKPIKQILDKLAFEGGFCYTFSAAGVLKYIFAKDSYSSADHTLDKNDLTNVQVSHTPISDMIMDITVNYNNHPAKNEYRSQATDSDSTLRTKYNIAATEQKHVFNLNYLTTGQGADLDCSSDDPNDGFMNYYGSLSVSPRIIVQAQIVNPAKFNMELGDICSFSSMPTDKAFNKSWTDSATKYYMITSITRSSGKITCKFINITPGEQ
tara:strand:- start:378 stop:2387 length:2010 start_codon:yes stop_codon:yes gene_type:complete